MKIKSAPAAKKVTLHHVVNGEVAVIDDSASLRMVPIGGKIVLKFEDCDGDDFITMIITFLIILIVG